MNILLEGAIQSSVILLLALAAMPLLRRRSAALRHSVLTAALACAAIAPLLGRVIPAWHLPVSLTSLTGHAPDARTALLPMNQDASAGPRRADPPAESSAHAPSFPIAAVIRTTWMAGTIVGLVLLVAGLARLTRLSERARRLEHPAWTRCADSVAREFGLARPVSLLLSRRASLLLTWGVLRPKVLLPTAAESWPDDRVRIVLYHELAHVRRCDWLVLVSAEALKCVYWFNPLAWIACARLRRESEQACDDEVLNRGVSGADYARVLVDIARDLKQQRRLWLPAPAIVRPSSLERRVRAMLDARINRRPVSRRFAAGVAAAALSISTAIASAQTGFASLSGSIVDPSDGVLPGVTLVLTNPQTQAKYEVRTDRSGRYEFVAVPAGEYQFEAKLPGFASFQGTLTIGAQSIQRDLRLEVASLQETVTVANSPASSSAVPVVSRPARPKRPLPDCGPAPTSEGVPVGGNIRAPHKLRDVKPVYPPQLAAQGVKGTVVLQARIGTNGLVEEVSVVSTPHEDLGHAAMDAVRLWEFDETLLNCKPVAVPMRVTVNFVEHR